MDSKNIPCKAWIKKGTSVFVFFFSPKVKSGYKGVYFPHVIGKRAASFASTEVQDGARTWEGGQAAASRVLGALAACRLAEALCASPAAPKAKSKYHSTGTGLPNQTVNAFGERIRLLTRHEEALVSRALN